MQLTKLEPRSLLNKSVLYVPALRASTGQSKLRFACRKPQRYAKGNREMLPGYWINFIKENKLEGASCKIPPEADLADLDEEGPDLYIMDESMSDEESTKFYPGIYVRKDGYIPVAGCEIGSGNPYFINTNDGENGPLYCIFHDEVTSEGYDSSRAIVKVLESYRDLAKYKED